MLSELGRGIEISLAECGSAAALPISCERNFKTERFEDLDRSDSNVRLVITHKRVVPENDFSSSVAAVCDRRIIRPTLIERRYKSRC
jgi:hypothetical protein